MTQRIQRMTRPEIEDRYAFDFDICSHRKGWAQIDTGQDAPYFGGWAHPDQLRIVTYAEGDITITTCDGPDDFADELKRMKDWNDESGWGMHIDGMCDEHIIGRFKALGLGELLH